MEDPITRINTTSVSLEALQKLAGRLDDEALNRRVTQFRGAAQGINNDISTLEQTYQSWVTDNNTLTQNQQQLAVLQADLQNKQTQLEQLDPQDPEYTTKRDALQQQINSINAQIGQLTTANANLQADMDALSTSIDNLVAKINSAYAQLPASYESLEQTLRSTGNAQTASEMADAWQQLQDSYQKRFAAVSQAEERLSIQQQQDVQGDAQTAIRDQVNATRITSGNTPRVSYTSPVTAINPDGNTVSNTRNRDDIRESARLQMMGRILSPSPLYDPSSLEVVATARPSTPFAAQPPTATIPRDNLPIRSDTLSATPEGGQPYTSGNLPPSARGAADFIPATSTNRATTGTTLPATTLTDTSLESPEQVNPEEANRPAEPFSAANRGQNVPNLATVQPESSAAASYDRTRDPNLMGQAAQTSGVGMSQMVNAPTPPQPQQEQTLSDQPVKEVQT